MRNPRMKDPAMYTGSPICMRCGSGWPCCTNRRDDGTRYTHDETCARYVWAYALCGRCSLEMARTAA